MGFNKPYLSFVNQVDRTTGSFSHCISSMSNSDHWVPSFLGFGSDRPRIPNPRSSKLHEHPSYSAYFINVTDVKLDNKPLDIPSQDFEGFVIDTDSSLSHIAERPFQILKQNLTEYLQRQRSWFPRVHELDSKWIKSYDLCFARPETIEIKQTPKK